jgi:GrpB-like predicted nucleotidyltransferase (UPF0157 family)
MEEDKGASRGDSTRGTSALGLIPQVFYDLIGRVVPGATVLAASSLLFEEPERLVEVGGSAFDRAAFWPFFSILTALLVSYVTGLLLGAIWFFFAGREWEKKPPSLSIHERPDLGHLGIRQSFMYDAVHLYNSAAGARLAKLRAEQHLCGVLVVGFSLLSAVRILSFVIGRGPATFWWPLVSFALVIAAAGVFHRHLRIRAARLLSNVWWALDLARKSRTDTARYASIEIVRYDPGWPEEFARERARIAHALGALAIRIDHHGSTAVPGLAAKPIVDIQIAVERLQPMTPYAAPLAALGYLHVPHSDDERCLFLHRPANWPHTHHVHVVVAGGEEERRTLAFRDALRADAGLRRDYEVLKRDLARFGGDSDASREAYAVAKTEFVERVLRSAASAER